MDYILNRLTERSTWQGIVALATGVGISLSPQLAEAIMAAGVAAAGLIHVIFPENGSPAA